MDLEEEDKLVEVIEDGRIAKVPEFYAKREGLPILRKSVVKKVQEEVAKSAPSYQAPLYHSWEGGMVIDNFRKPNWKEKQVLLELVDNFHWVIRVERRRKGLTRKQLAKLINEREETLKMIENGVLPAKDFVLVNKIQSALGINLRKDKKDFSKSAHDMIKEGGSVGGGESLGGGVGKEDLKGVYGDEIDILEGEV